ncbi:helix-turn-helix transcriptional regulator [Nocardioides bizhenqiangii]|uniref:WYL domain-containing protein n=1 Tax=Nocardioides bizhenqiangii TaxID=3095076 RepID=A0ABZ0ZU22_9ACTN|nr:WYL domain-containing protein [Nocardioides sp. HM61]WQQ27738.1 WYL domain-containing protein [Nocardioides sp. HM61]
MERLVRIAATLRERGTVGETGERLAEIAGFEGERPMDQLKRDIRSLTDQGWQIDNIAGPGEPARYRMRTVDNRLRVRLTPPQQRALQRAVLLADRNDLIDRLGLGDSVDPGGSPHEAGVVAGVPTTGHDALLATVLQAVRMGSLLRFTYKGTPRVVHPESVRSQNGTWYLRGQEEGSDGPSGDDAPVKAFVVARMSDVAADPPRSARPVRAARHRGLHPMSWEIDPPVEVTLQTTTEHQPDVRRWLGDPAAEETDPSTGSGTPGQVTMRYVVTHRAALRARLYELGRRVVLVGPEDVRSELLAELYELKGGD